MQNVGLCAMILDYCLGFTKEQQIPKKHVMFNSAPPQSLCQLFGCQSALHDCAGLCWAANGLIHHTPTQYRVIQSVVMNTINRASPTYLWRDTMQTMKWMAFHAIGHSLWNSAKFCAIFPSSCKFPSSNNIYEHRSNFMNHLFKRLTYDTNHYASQYIIIWLTAF